MMAEHLPKTAPQPLAPGVSLREVSRVVKQGSWWSPWQPVAQIQGA